MFFKQELEHDFLRHLGMEKNEWLSYLKNDVLSIAIIYARYSEGMEKLIGYGMK